MKYSPRNAIRHIARGFGIELTDDEVARIIAESIDSIEGHGLAVREAARKYEEHVMALAADMVARRLTTQSETSAVTGESETNSKTDANTTESKTTEPEAHMDASQHSN